MSEDLTGERVLEIFFRFHTMITHGMDYLLRVVSILVEFLRPSSPQKTCGIMFLGIAIAVFSKLVFSASF